MNKPALVSISAACFIVLIVSVFLFISRDDAQVEPLTNSSIAIHENKSRLLKKQQQTEDALLLSEEGQPQSAIGLEQSNATDSFVLEVLASIDEYKSLILKQEKTVADQLRLYAILSKCDRGFIPQSSK